jgi:hypothetical protein
MLSINGRVSAFFDVFNQMGWRKLVLTTGTTIAEGAIGDAAVKSVVADAENFTSFLGIEVTHKGVQVSDDWVRDGGSGSRSSHAD